MVKPRASLRARGTRIAGGTWRTLANTIAGCPEGTPEMSKSPALRRWLSVGATVVVLAAVLAVVGLQKSSQDAAAARAQQAREDAARAWPLFGGSVSRNLVNLVEKDIPTDWDVTPNKQKNVKWAVNLGSKAYGGPIVAGGKIFIGTNNNLP